MMSFGRNQPPEKAALTENLKAKLGEGHFALSKTEAIIRRKFSD